MSGRIQHNIPQSLLRGFGKRKGDFTQVAVYSKSHGVFTRSTGGIAAQRDFYSEPTEDVRTETLDDKITQYESQLASRLAEFRESPLSSAVDPRAAAEIVIHLCVRNAHLRSSFSVAAGEVINGATSMMLDSHRARKLFGLEGAAPTRAIKEAIGKLYCQFRTQLKQRGVSKSKFERWAFSYMRDQFEGIHGEIALTMRGFLVGLESRTTEMTRKAHNSVLEENLIPSARIEDLQRLVWYIETGPPAGLVLPDCVAIGVIGGTYRPLSYTEKDAASAVIMPLSHD